MFKKILLVLIFYFGYETQVLANFYVGINQVNINPTESEMPVTCLGGYQPFSRCGSTEIHDPITVRSLAIADDDTLMIFAVLDSIGVGDALIREIKNKVNQITDGEINPEQIYITATHTHSGPDLQGLWGGVDENYRQRIIKRSAKAIIESVRRSECADIYVTQTMADVRNRRGWDTVDRSVSVLDFRNARTDSRIGTLVNMSAHPTILGETNLAYSSDYIHSVRKSVERNLGGTAIFINGVLGDAEPEIDDHTFESARQFGNSVAKSVVRSLHKETKKVEGDLEIRSVDFTHRVTNEAVIGAVYAGLLDLDLSDNLTVTPRLSFFTLGDLVSGLSFPGEALTRLGLPIKKEMPAEHPFFFGLADGSLGYFIPSDEFLQIEGRTTEESASLDVFIGDSVKSTILEALLIP